jgi:hypothetical protein
MPGAGLLRYPTSAASYGLFLLKTCSKGYDIPDEPHLDAEAAAYFIRRLSRASVYLEYGMGGSTQLAWGQVEILTGVESDGRFLGALRKKLQLQTRRPDFAELHYADIGLTTNWGEPLFKKPSPARLRAWRQYTLAPWESLMPRGIQPDTILIDGRFRVACALTSLLRMAANSPCELLIDDYADRPHYHAVEAFADKVALCGRMAVFRKPRHFHADACEDALARYIGDYR